MLMHFIRQHPVFALLIGTAMLAAVVLSTGITVLAIANHRAKTKLKQRQHELRTLAAAGLLLNEAEAKLAAQKVAEVEQQNVELFAGDSSPTSQIAAESVVATSTDAFFELAAFVERMAAQGRSFGVETAASERFGFATYAQRGPDQELIPSVLKQQKIVERVLKHLFAARPERLVFVARERPMPSSGSQTNAVGTSNTDQFAFSPLHSLRVDGETSTTAVRIGFVGDTAVLRNFVNAMTKCDPRLLVRSVEAEGLRDDATNRTTVESQSRVQNATIRERTKFTVVVEAFEFLRLPLPETVGSSL